MSEFWQMCLPVKWLPLQLRYRAFPSPLKASSCLIFSAVLQRATGTKLAFSRILYKWNYRVCILGSFFTQQNDFEIHSCYCMYQWFIPFYCWVIVFCLDTPHFVYSSVSWHLCFQLLAIVKKAAMNTCVQVFVWCMF